MARPEKTSNEKTQQQQPQPKTDSQVIPNKKNPHPQHPRDKQDTAVQR
ncbi:hypothetical protein [Acinetobacter indicus]|nr:hypothetical protein [Acinetobacter indicus]